MNYPDLLAKVERTVEPVLESLGLELVEREFVHADGRWVLRIYIDQKEGGGLVTVGDCQKASRAIEGVMDVEDFIPHAYRLEVSSPGLNRPLRKKKDFERFAGERIDLDTKDLFEGRRHFTGILKGLRGEEIVILEGEREWRIPWGLMKKTRRRN